MKKSMYCYLSFIILTLLILLILTGCTNNHLSSRLSQVYTYTDFSTDQSILNKSLLDSGNGNRIIAAMQRAGKGEEIVIGYIGGSITWGASAKSRNEGYAHLVYNWWVNKFPKSKVKMINAGLSGTGSILGAHRIESDLLNRKPDVIIMEFAVNDDESDMTNEAYENMTRAVLKADNNPGLIMLFMTLDSGYNTQEQKAVIGKYYEIPMISFRDGIIPSIEKGDLEWNTICADFIHPNSEGHKIVAEMLIYQLEQWYEQIDQSITVDTDLPKPLTLARFERTDFYTNKTLIPIELGGFELNDHAYWNLPEGWKAIEVGKPMIFEVTGKTIGLVYNQTLDFKGANVKVTIDDNTSTIITSHSPYTYEYLSTDILYESDVVATHRVAIELLDEAPDKCSGENFYLLGVLTSK